MNDITQVLLLPSLLERFKFEAPGVKINTMALSDSDTEAALGDGVADLAIGYFPDISSALKQRHILKTKYVCIAARDHPAFGTAITRKEFLSARYAIAEARGSGHHAVELALQREGVADQIGVRVSGFLPLPMIVAASDMVASVPWQLAQLMRESTKINIMPHPLKLPPLEIRQFWHSRYHSDPGNVWLRQLLGELYKPVVASASKGLRR